MPSEREIRRVQPMVLELMSPHEKNFDAKKETAKEVGDAAVGLAEKAEGEAAKYILLKGAVHYYALAKEYDLAADALEAIRAAVKEFPDGKGGCLEGHTVVGSYLPNAWGLYDMHGNVTEWCLDWNADLSGGVTDPVGPSKGTRRVGRGGCWHNSSGACTSSLRFDFHVADGSNTRSFRLARTLSE